MGFTKNKGLSVVIALILLIIFNIVAFMLPSNHGVLFWVGYSFAIFSQLFVLTTVIIFLGKETKERQFHALPSLSVAWLYVVLQTIFSIRQMTGFALSYQPSVILNCVMATVAVILTILLGSATTSIEKLEFQTAQQTFFIKNMQTDVELLKSNDTNLEKKLRKLAETIRFSDPMSHSHLLETEGEIIDKFYQLRKNIDNTAVAITLCDDLDYLFAIRNKKCKVLKGIPEDNAEVDNSGLKIAGIAFGVVSLLIVGLLTVVLFVIPNNKYNEAIDLYECGRYEEAIEKFSDLGNFRESELRIETANQKLIEQKYANAQQLYDEKKYIEAIEIYESLGDYKDSKDTIEHIYNMLAENEEIYFGVYKGKPIPWKVLETQQDKILLIAQKPIEQRAFNDELKNVTWETSTIRKWLNDDFMSEFSDKQKNRIVELEQTGDDIFLLDKELYNAYAKKMSLVTDSDWWLRDKTESGMMFVNGANGEVNTVGETVVRGMGVRPCVWVTLR